MADQYDKQHSTPQGDNFSPKEGMVQEKMDAQVHKIRQEDERQGGAIPTEAGDDFTFPDEDTTLGRKVGDDIPGEKSNNRD